MGVWLEMWVDFVYWQWGGRALDVSVSFLYRIPTHSAMFGAAMKGGGGGLCVFMAWHGTRICTTVSL